MSQNFHFVLTACPIYAILSLRICFVTTLYSFVSHLPATVQHPDHPLAAGALAGRLLHRLLHPQRPPRRHVVGQLLLRPGRPSGKDHVG